MSTVRPSGICRLFTTSSSAWWNKKYAFMFLSELRFVSSFLNLLFTRWCILEVTILAQRCYDENEVALALHILVRNNSTEIVWTKSYSTSILKYLTIKLVMWTNFFVVDIIHLRKDVVSLSASTMERRLQLTSRWISTGNRFMAPGLKENLFLIHQTVRQTSVNWSWKCEALTCMNEN
jgi:hypothetical protein